MINDPKIFYKTFLSEYHWHKIRLLKSSIDSYPNSAKSILGADASAETLESYLKMLKSEMRQAYFHCAETMFTLLFALDPLSNGFDDENAMLRITNMDIKYVYDRVLSIANTEQAINFLTKDIRKPGGKERIQVGNYIFYYGIDFSNPKFSDLRAEIFESVEAIKHGVRIIAKDFSNREEYNSYKHGLRIVSAINGVTLADPETMSPKFRFDLANSVSYFRRQKDDSVLESVTVVFDTERDYQMTSFCSNLILSMIETRRAAMFKVTSHKDGARILIYDTEVINQNAKISEGAYRWSLKTERVDDTPQQQNL